MHMLFTIVLNIIESLDAIRALAFETAQTWSPDYQMNEVQEMIFKEYYDIPYKKQKLFCI